ncbi:hypothetical protein BKA69DRAFT_1171075 [Paraphysoderma sedebokerense]|nr:hypothetical protein BKA69DRAFT_1171075 [Paraphysoderma sedebokerense]
MANGNMQHNNDFLERSFETSFEGLFNNEEGISRLVLPIFQRPYLWGPEHVGKLVKDVDSARQSGDRSYFAGNIVLVESETPGDYFIIDGQQRITTVVMMISVCRHIDPEHQNIYTNWLTRQLPPQLQGIARPYRLWPDNGDDPTQNVPTRFEDYILAPRGIHHLLQQDENVDVSRYVQRLRRNVLRITEFLQDIGQVNTLDFARYMVRKCKFISVISRDLEAAYKVFCSINLPSGLPFARMDLYRANLYGTLQTGGVGDGNAQRCLRDWNDIERSVGSAVEMQRFLIHFCCVQMYSDDSRDAQSRNHAICNALDRQESISEPMIQVLLIGFFNRLHNDRITQELRRFCTLYRRVVRTQQYLRNADPPRRHPLHLLRYMSTQTQKWDLWITIALKAASVAAPNSPNLIFWKKLEIRFAYWLSTRARTVEIVAACDEILKSFNGLQPNQVGNHYQWNQLDLNEQEVTTFRRTINGNIYRKSPFAARYLLLHLEQRRSHLELLTALVSGRIAATVEHICPQTPRQDSNWLQEPWSDGERRQLVHQIGNLAILEKTHNTEVLNFGWNVKSEVYRNNRRGETTPFSYTGELCEEPDWTPDLCRARQQRLVEELFEIYNLFDGGQIVDGDGEDDDSGGDERPDWDNEVMDDPSENEVMNYPIDCWEDTELCQKTVKGAPDEYKVLKCAGQRGPSEPYCGTCHSWDSEQEKQCEKERKKGSPYCENHKGKEGNNNNDRPKPASAKRSSSSSTGYDRATKRRINQDDSQLQNNPSHGSKYEALIEQICIVRQEYNSTADSDEKVRLQLILDELLAEKNQLDDLPVQLVVEGSTSGNFKTLGLSKKMKANCMNNH